jgi:hypothetical protein
VGRKASLMSQYGAGCGRRSELRVSLVSEAG